MTTHKRTGHKTQRTNAQTHTPRVNAQTHRTPRLGVTRGGITKKRRALDEARVALWELERLLDHELKANERRAANRKRDQIRRQVEGRDPSHSTLRRPPTGAIGEDERESWTIKRQTIRILQLLEED